MYRGETCGPARCAAAAPRTGPTRAHPKVCRCPSAAARRSLRRPCAAPDVPRRRWQGVRRAGHCRRWCPRTVAGAEAGRPPGAARCRGPARRGHVLRSGLVPGRDGRSPRAAPPESTSRSQRVRPGPPPRRATGPAMRPEAPARHGRDISRSRPPPAPQSSLGRAGRRECPPAARVSRAPRRSVARRRRPRRWRGSGCLAGAVASRPPGSGSAPAARWTGPARPREGAGRRPPRPTPQRGLTEARARARRETRRAGCSSWCARSRR